MKFFKIVFNHACRYIAADIAEINQIQPQKNRNAFQFGVETIEIQYIAIRYTPQMDMIQSVNNDIIMEL